MQHLYDRVLLSSAQGIQEAWQHRHREGPVLPSLHGRWPFFWILCVSCSPLLPLLFPETRALPCSTRAEA